MSSRFPNRAVVLLLALGLAAPFVTARELRVCADPDNLPFSNRQQQGFENRIAELLASELHARLTYEWQRMGRGFVREFLNKSRCDLLIGIPKDFRAVLTTSPYYRSTFVFVSRRDAEIKPASLDDPRLGEMKIGVQAMEEEYTPPGQALARRGLQNSIVGFHGVGQNARAIIEAVVQRQVNAAIVWGPLAAYFARDFGDTLVLTPLVPEMDSPNLPFTFEISMGVRKGNEALRDELEAVLQQRQSQIRRILSDYAVPQLELQQASRAGL